MDMPAEWEWIDELHNKYLHLFVLHEGEDGRFIKKGMPARGIECPEAWKDLVITFLDRIEWIRTNNLHLNNGSPHDIKIFQIKEKFATPRIYVNMNCVDNIERQVYEAIAYFEGMARTICQLCGRIGNKDGTLPQIDRTGWIMVVCNECTSKK